MGAASSAVATLGQMMANGGVEGLVARQNLDAAQAQRMQAEVPLVQAQAGLTQQQTVDAALTNQLKQQQLRDARIIQQGYASTDGSLGALRDYVLKNGISGPGFMNWQASDIELRKKSADLTKEQNDTYSTNLSRVGQTLGEIQQLPLEQRQAALTNAMPALKRYEPDYDWSQMGTDDASLLGHQGVANYVATLHKTQADAQEAVGKAAQATAEAAGAQQKTAQERRAQFTQQLSAVVNPQTGEIDPDAYQQLRTQFPEQKAPALPSNAWIAQTVTSGVPIEKQPDYLITRNLATMKPEDFTARVDALNLPGPLAARTKQLVGQALALGDRKGALAAIKDASDQMGRTETAVTTANAEIPGKIQAAVATARAMNGTGAVANVPPHLAPTAIAAYNKSGESLAAAQTSADDIQVLLDMAASGNKAAGANVALAGVAAINAVNGIKRINSAEIAQYGTAGSLLDKIQGKLQGWTEGQPIPADVLSDMKALHAQLANGAVVKHAHEVEAINKAYGSTFEPMKFQTKPPASNQPKSVASQADFDALPSGTVYTNAKDGKQYRKP